MGLCFKELTGLDEEVAEYCLAVFEMCEGMALASVVQSRNTLPDHFFDDVEALTRHKKEIDERLKYTYTTVQLLMEIHKFPEKRAWLEMMRGDFEDDAGDEGLSAVFVEGKKVPNNDSFDGPVFTTNERNVESSKVQTENPFNTMFCSFPRNTAGPSGSSAFSAAQQQPPVPSSLNTNPFLAFGAQQPKQDSLKPVNPFAIKESSAKVSREGHGAPNPFSLPQVSVGNGFGSGFGKPAAPSTVTRLSDTVTKPRAGSITPPTNHPTCSFSDLDYFWGAEVHDGNTPLFLRDNGFLESMGPKKLRERQEKWLESANFYKSAPLCYTTITDRDENTARVIILDAVRTFADERSRTKFETFLFSMFNEFGHYGQAMSYLAGLCLITLNEQETAAILRRVAKDYIPGHWKAEAVGFATNAWVVEHLLRNTPQFKPLMEHFQSINFWPDTYLQKIMSGLCVHMMDFADLFTFLDGFMKGGFLFLVKFVFSLFSVFEERLQTLGAGEMGELYQIMRLDSTVVSKTELRTVLALAPEMDIGISDEEVGPLRSDVYNEKVAPRLNNAAKEEEIEPCETCDKNVPSLYCDECGPICTDCTDTFAGTHNRYHRVEKY